MRVRLGIALFVAFLALSATARADDYAQLSRCVASGDEECLAEVGLRLASEIKDPAKKSLMVARFGLLERQNGRSISGNALLMRAWAIAQSVPNVGCANRTLAIFALEDLTREFGHRDASRLMLRALVKDSESWSPTAGTDCRRGDGAVHWLEQVADRQASLGDTVGVGRTLDVAQRLAMDPALKSAGFAPTAPQAAALLKRGGRDAEAIKVCDAHKAAELKALPEYHGAAEEAAALWRGLDCYRTAGLTKVAQTVYGDYAQKRLEALGLGADASEAPADQDLILTDELWTMMQDLTWSDPVLAPVAGDFQTKSPRACFEKPTARCLTLHGMAYVEQANRGTRRRLAGGTGNGSPSSGSLDGFARFLVGADVDPVGEEARTWFLEQTEEEPLERLQSLVGDAIRTGDLVWARRIFYSWYEFGGDTFFRRLTDKDRSNTRTAGAVRRAAWTEGDADEETPELAEGQWPLHVAWTIALIVSELDPAFEPEELAEFGATAWDDGIMQLPSLKDIPRLELIDADERSGTHLLNLCFRNAFGQWAADLFTSAHVPERAAAARAVLPEASRDCAFARRSVGPMVRTASWLQSRGDQAGARDLLSEAAHRLTRPHYHVYEDADPEMGGAAVAAAAIGLARGLNVPPPYEASF